ncbi:MAG: peptidase S41 [Bacteroidales bacterium]|nr:peptidase S41 [Bacteroidales bacterium]MCF8457787.1 peptidase S41 [Bacteroidales bacterium]
MTKYYLPFLYILISYSSIFSQDSPLWMRYPAISPDGKTIVFSFGGDLYTVPSSGGEAKILTIHEAYDFRPVWSRDGKNIAFASDRFGNFDVFVISAEGGKTTRLTFHSSSDYPSDFTSDNKHVIFTSARLDASSNRQFPTGALPELYQVPVEGGRVKQILTTPAEKCRMSSDGSKLIFHDRKGYENAWRKHHTSSVTRDVWMYDISSKEYKQLSSFEGEDQDPVFASNNQDVYYLSEEMGDFNIFKTNLTNPAQKEQITTFSKHPIRFLSISNVDVLCFGHHGNIYTKTPSGTPQKINISISTEDRHNAEKNIHQSGGVSDMAVSPNGKEIAMVIRGEVFVSSISEGTSKRITSTPEQERNVQFSPDGRSVLYASERNNSWNLYQTSLGREEEKYFFNSTLLNEEVLLETDKETFQPSYSPDGKEVAFLEERTTLKVINLKSKKVREIVSGDKNYSYTDGDQYYAWSPDSKWFLVNFLPAKSWKDEVGLVSAEGGIEIINLTQSGFGDYSPKWGMKGELMYWFSDRDGMKNRGGWGSEQDIYGMFLTQDAWDKFTLPKEEYELLKEDEKKKDKKKNKKKEDEEDEKKDEKIEPLKFDLTNIEDRKTRLTIHSSRLSDALLSGDGEKLYYLSSTDKGFDLWQTELKSKETKIILKGVSKSSGSLHHDKDWKNLFVLSGGKISKIELEKSKKTEVAIKAEMNLNEADERAYLYEHIWRQVKKKFYVDDLHNVDWEGYKKEYALVLPSINNNYDFAEMLSELLGELNASHTGASYWPQTSMGDETASLGLFYDESYTGDGLKIIEVMDKSPVIKKDSKIKAGVIIEKIGGEEITADMNYYTLLNRIAHENVLLSLYDPDKRKRWDEVVRPISRGEENELQYKRWVENCRAIVEKASDGKIGYVHVRGMNDRSYRVVYEEVLGKNHDKEALVVDTRFNGGGWLHDDLATFLGGKLYISISPRGQDLGTEPQFKWAKPSCVVMSESNYSDAHMFPFTYRALGIGKLIGMPVPGTGTAVWWERLQNGVTFGIPQVGMVSNNGKYLENTQLEPDIKVPNEPGKVCQGQDQQLEAAVKELMKGVGE